jgi:hypothetical protein
METSTELRELTLSLYKSQEKGDSSYIERLMTRQNGSLIIGSDPDEWWTGYENIVKELRSQDGIFVGSSLTGDPQAYVRGDVGWVADHLEIVFSDGTEIFARSTMVFEKEAGEWKIVLWHFSVGIPNVDAGFGDV